MRFGALTGLGQPPLLAGRASSVLPSRAAGGLLGWLAPICLSVAALLPMAAVADPNTSTLRFSAADFRHFDHLVTPATMDGGQVDIINIYSVAPDYKFATEPREGYACVDDAARAEILLATSLEKQPDPGKLHQLELLTAFVLQMQNQNGFFNNFIWPDGSINTTFKTSVAELNWWSFRALWGLEAARRVLPADSDLTRRVSAAADRLVANLKRDLPANSRKTERVAGLDTPSWLPSGSGADQGAVAIIGLLPYYERTHDHQVLALIIALADGVKRMQAGDARHYPYGVHLSSGNLWHAWGSDQAYALLLAGKRLHRADYIASGLLEIDHFYPYLLDHGYFAALSVRKVGGRYVAIHQEQFPQIAYGIRPMVYAAVEAYHLTGKPRYLTTARRLSSWLTGDNDAHEPVYDDLSGRVYDGIKPDAKINRDSGAESTVEGLLTLLKLEGEQRP